MSEPVFNAAKASVIQAFETYDEKDQTEHTLNEIIDRFINNMPEYSNIDKGALSFRIQSEISLSWEEHDVLIQKDWEKWLYPSGKPINENRKDISWSYTEDYLRLVETKWNKKSAEKLKAESLEVLNYIQDPEEEGSWYVKGTIFGDIQSGKTANYNGLICRAADAGYKFFIILAGAHKDLRSQTQSRLDFDFRGKSTNEPIKKIGVGRYKNHPPVNTFTTSKDNGDFKSTHPDVLGLDALPDTPTYVIVKKNTSILKNLYKWLKDINRNVPLLFIDDECDYASVDTSKVDDEEYNPKAINLGIRKILSLFDRKSYVGYTATPYANIFIHYDKEHEEFGPDLFPDNFILSIKAPDIYIGPKQYFGINENGDPEDINDLPLTRIVSDHGDLTNEHITYIPDSLKEALKSFFISSAVKYARGYNTFHNTMLIHVVRFIKQQEDIYKLVDDEVKILIREIRHGDCEEFRILYEEDKDSYLDTTKELLQSENISDNTKKGLENFTWDIVKPFLKKVSEKLLIKEVNGRAGDVLEYDKHPSGINYIAIGGDKLSRGLTLEGLSVSYYLRTASYNDTLLQMGRWFGYRPGYLDLCRIYTTYGLIENFREISEANEILISKLKEMKDSDLTPREFGLYVKTSSGNLTVTNVGKRRHTLTADISFDGDRIQTSVMFMDKDKIQNNFLAVNDLLSKPLKNDIVNFGWIMDNVNYVDIIDFLNNYNVHFGNKRFMKSLVIDYIKSAVAQQRCKNWVILLADKESSKHQSEFSFGIDQIKVGITKRNSFIIKDNTVRYPSGNFVSPNHIDTIESIYPDMPILMLYNLYGDKDGNHYGTGESQCIGLAIKFPSKGFGSEVTARVTFNPVAIENLQLSFWDNL